MIEINEIQSNVEAFVIEYFGEDFKFRKKQKETIVSIIDTILNTETLTHIVEAPTGSGKSLINIISAGVLYKYYGKRSFILVSDLSLWDQYADFINKNPKLGFGKLKGKQNYKCSANGEHIDSAECKLAGVKMGSLMIPGNAHKLGFPCAEYCSYLRDRKRALESPVTLLTYALYLYTVDKNNMDGQIQAFDARDVVFCDECHNIPNIIQMFYGKSISRDHIKWCAKLYSYANDMFDGILFNEDNDIHEELNILNTHFKTEDDIYDKYDLIYDKLIDYRTSKEQDIETISELVDFWDLFTPIKNAIEESLKLKSKGHVKLNKHEKEILKFCRSHQSYVSCSSIRQFLQIINNVGTEYLVKSLTELENKDFNVTLQCAKEDYMTYSGLLDVTPKHVMLSATVGDKDNFDDNIGVKYLPVKESKMSWIDSSFDFSNSPIYFLNRYKMSWREKDESMKNLKPIIYKTCEQMTGKKGMIQTGNYAIAKDIIDNAPEHIKRRLLYYNGSKEKSEVIITHQMSQDTILIGPTLNEGIDLPGDLCRFIIILKMPYPNLKDRLVDAKIKLFPYWYNSTTSNAIIQGIGRGNRFEDDWCKTYILDACFMKLYTDTQSQYPEYIRNRIKFYN
jgi:Rad3-related DNA helicase